MRKDHKIAFLFSYWWVLLLAVLGIAPFLLGNYEGMASEKENRMLQGLPSISVSNWMDGSFATELESFLSDQMPARAEILNTSAMLLNLFDVRTAEEIIMSASVGKELETAGGMEEDTSSSTEPVSEIDGETGNILAENEPEDSELLAEGNSAESTDQDDPEVEVLENVTVGEGNVGDLSVVRSVYYKCTDGSIKVMFHFGENAMRSVVSALNAYRDVLPEDGAVYFTYVPDSQRADVWLLNKEEFNGWHSEVEETMQANVKDGVHVYSSVNTLEPYMQAGELVYYMTDHHWTGRGAYRLIQKMMQDKNTPIAQYEDYTYTTYDSYRGTIYQSAKAMAKTSVSDHLEIPAELMPVNAAEYHNLNELKKKVRYMEPERGSYAGYLGGTHTPFFVIETGFHTGRNALVISDSFGNAFIPYLVPYYDRVCQTDLRGEYPFVRDGHGVSEYIREWEIDDVFFVVSNGNGVNAQFMRQNAKKYL